MRRIVTVAVVISFFAIAFEAGSAYAARRRTVTLAKTYQVTGPVLEVTNEMIVVQKGKERWEVARDSSSKVTGDLKVGATVTIQYKMTAVAVTVQAAKPAAAAKGKPAPANP